MFKTLKTIFQKEKQTKYFAEFRVNGKYRKIELSKMPKDNRIKAGIFVLFVQSQREETTKDTIEIISQCTYITTKY